MLFKVREILQIEKREIFLLLLLMSQAVFIGIFFGGFDISMHAIFFDAHSIEKIPLAFIVSGVAGLVIFTLYTFFSTRFPFKFFVLCNYFVALATTSAIFYFSAIEFNSDLTGIGFALMFPLNILVFLNFWRNAREILTPSQTKRLIKYIQLGFYGGIVGISYGLILYLYTSDNIHMILFGSILCLAAGIAVQFLINLTHRFSPRFLHKQKKINPLHSRFTELFYTRYTFLLFLFVVLSSLIGYILHFNFIISTRLSYPGILGFTKFLGLFVGSMFLFVFFVDKLLIRKLLYSYDSPYSIVLIPVAVLIFLVLMIGIYLTLGTTTAIARFSYSFLFMAMVKIVYETSKYDIEIPSLRVMFNTLDIRFIATIIPRIEGFTRNIALLIAGVALYFITSLGFIKILHINLLTVFLSLCWLFVAVKLIHAYRSALQNTIRRYKSAKKTREQELFLADEKLYELVNHKSHLKVISSLSISEKIEPIRFEKHLTSLIAINSPKVQEFILKKIEDNTLLGTINVLKEIRFENKSLDNYKNTLLQRFKQKISLGITEKQVEKLAQSKNVNDRVLAAELIGYLQKKELSSILINLSRDFEPDVKQASIRSMARVAFSETCHTLIGFLNSPDYYTYASEALVKIGDDGIGHLEEIFNMPDVDNQLLSRIVKIYGKIGTATAMECLLNKVERQNRFVARQAVIAMREARFQATPVNINRIMNSIVKTIHTMSWNFSVHNILRKSKRYTHLTDALETEISSNYQMLYHLLSLAYNSTSISNIRKLLVEGSDTDISFAVELLDEIVLEDVKQVLFPIIENLSTTARIKQLQYFFQTEKLTIRELLPEIIVRDYNLISIYTKACAIYSWPEYTTSIDHVMISNLFHPNKLIRETAAFVIQTLDPSVIPDVLPRLERNYAQDVEASLHSIEAGTDMLVLNKIRFLKTTRVFRNIPEDILSELAVNLTFVRLPKDGAYTVFKENGDHALIMVSEGLLEANLQENEKLDLKTGDVFYADLFFHDSAERIALKAVDNSAFLILKKEALDMLLFDYSEIRAVLLELLDLQLK